MKDLSEPLYSQQIYIPPTFPHVLKIYAKAAIRTQPYDLLTWSASYFRALAEGRSPPVKTRLEYPLIKSKGGLSPGYLKLLIKQLSNSTEIDVALLKKRWIDVCLKENELKQILCIGGSYNESHMVLYKFVAIAAGFLCKSLTQTMILLCELFTEEPDGGSSAISADLFVDMYVFLARIDSSREQKFINGVLQEPKMPNFDHLKDIYDDTELKEGRNTESTASNESANNFTVVEKPIEANDDFIRHEKITTDESGFSESTLDTDRYDEPKNNSDEYNATNEDSSSSPIVKRTVTLRVFSEDGEKIASSSAMSIREDETQPPYLQINKEGELFLPKKDVSVEDREAIIKEIQKVQDEKVKNMEAVMDSVEDLAERARMMARDADILSSRKSAEINGDFISDEVGEENKQKVKKIEVDPNAKGVVNPIFKGLFDNVADKMGVVSAFQTVEETVIVPRIPGIGPIVDDDMIEEFLKYARETAADQCDMFMPRDIRHYFCPPLEKI